MFELFRWLSRLIDDLWIDLFKSCLEVNLIESCSSAGVGKPCTARLLEEIYLVTFRIIILVN